jgi:hypothetical protein
VWLRWFLLVIMPYSRADNSWPVSFADCAWEWVYATNLSRLQRERERNKETACARSTAILCVVTEAKQCHCACSPAEREKSEFRIRGGRQWEALPRCWGVRNKKLRLEGSQALPASPSGRVGFNFSIRDNLMIHYCRYGEALVRNLNIYQS